MLSKRGQNHEVRLSLQYIKGTLHPLPSKLIDRSDKNLSTLVPMPQVTVFAAYCAWCEHSISQTGTPYPFQLSSLCPTLLQQPVLDWLASIRLLSFWKITAALHRRLLVLSVKA